MMEYEISLIEYLNHKWTVTVCITNESGEATFKTKEYNCESELDAEFKATEELEDGTF